jgi:hypothetical protein
MKTIYKDSESTLGIEDVNDTTIRLTFKNIYGENTNRMFNIEDDDFEMNVDQELRWWGIRDTPEVLDKIDEFIF